MIKIKKHYNLIIFTLIGMFLSSNLAYPSSSKQILRLPVGKADDTYGEMKQVCESIALFQEGDSYADLLDSLVAQPLMPLREEPIKIFIIDLLIKYWDISNLPSQWIPQIFEILAKGAEDAEAAIQIVQQKFPDLVNLDSGFTKSYKAARASKFSQTAEWLKPHLKGPVLADIGAGDDQLISALRQVEPTITQAFATDIFAPLHSSGYPNCIFIPQVFADSTLLKCRSINTMTMSVMLHHIEPSIQHRLLTHAVSVIKPGGRLIIIEDSFPEGAYQLSKDDFFAERFLAFSTEDKLKVLGFLDWWGNRFMKNNSSIPLPLLFESIEHWQARLEDLGLKKITAEFVGFPEMSTHMMMPKALFVYERPLRDPWDYPLDLDEDSSTYNLDYYEASRTAFKNKGFSEPVEVTAMQNNPQSYHFLFTILKKFVPNLEDKTIFEFGTAQGCFVELLNSLGFNATGIEIIKEFVQHARTHGLNIHEGTILEIPPALQDIQFDVTLSHDVLDALVRVGQEEEAGTRYSRFSHEEELQALSNLALLTKENGYSIHQVNTSFPFSIGEYRRTGFDIRWKSPAENIIVLQKITKDFKLPKNPRRTDL